MTMLANTHVVYFDINIDPGYIMVNEICLSNFMSIIHSVGGINMLISVAIVVCVIIGYLIIILFQKLT